MRLFTLIVLLAFSSNLANAQQDTPWTTLNPGSENIEVLGHVPLGPMMGVSDLDLEQEMHRPYAYVTRKARAGLVDRGLDIIDLADPSNPKVIHKWRIENQDLHSGSGGVDTKYFKLDGRYYVVVGLQFGTGPNSDLGAVVLDVTGLPDATTVTEVARIYEPELPGGFHNIFIYKHSDGRVLLMATVRGPGAHVYDLGKLIAGDRENALAAVIPVPGDQGPRGSYHDFYAGYHEDSGTDRFYGGGSGGYYVYDISDLDNPDLLVTLNGITGVNRGHTVTPGPRGKYLITETEYQYAPLRIFDLQPGLDGETSNINRPISAWTAHWENLVHNHEVRWPYVFVSGYHDGLQVFSMMDPDNPVTVGYYDTYTGSRDLGSMGGNVGNGAFGVDVRNADGLIVVSDISTGFWTFRMEGFNGWNGEDWGVPDISSVQKWDEESKEGTR